MTTPIHETPMMHTHTIEATNQLSPAMKRKLASLSLDFAEITSPTHTMFVVNQNTEAEREAVRTLGRQIAAYEQQQYEKVAPQQSLEEAKKLRRVNLIRMFTLRQPLESLPEALKEDNEPDIPPIPVNVPERPSQAPAVR